MREEIFESVPGGIARWASRHFTGGGKGSAQKDRKAEPRRTGTRLENEHEKEKIVTDTVRSAGILPGHRIGFLKHGSRDAILYVEGNVEHVVFDRTSTFVNYFIIDGKKVRSRSMTGVRQIS